MQQQQTDVGKDPKTMVTPYAFTIADSVLYTPLASPLKRALAIVIDGIFITVLAEQMDWMFVVLVAGILFIQRRSRQLGRLLKWGLYGLMLVCMLLAATSLLRQGEQVDSDVTSAHDTQNRHYSDALDIIQSLPAVISLSLCEDYACAEAQLLALQQAMDTSVASRPGFSPRQQRQMALDIITNSELSKRDKAALHTAMIDGRLWPLVEENSEVKTQQQIMQPQLQSDKQSHTPLPSQADKSSHASTVFDGVVANQGAESSAESRPDTPLVPLTQAELSATSEAKVASQPMMDSEANDETLSKNTPRESSPHDPSTMSSQDESQSVIAWVKGIMLDMGLGFGWAAFYFTVFIAWFDGQTLGKKLLGIRVIKLDGSPIRLWAAFGRYGGYAAGFTTGLLGFLQIFWDANRQGIQDKISSTVVIDLVKKHKKQRLEQQEALTKQAIIPVLADGSGAG